jgi:hypothetical protein
MLPNSIFDGKKSRENFRFRLTIKEEKKNVIIIASHGLPIFGDFTLYLHISKKINKF